MQYLLQYISLDEQDKIVRDAGPILGKLYSVRGGFFEYNPRHQWVIDRERDSYLLYGPVMTARRDHPSYHFFFQGTMYYVELNMFLDYLVTVPEEPTQPLLAQFREALVAALTAYGPYGDPHPHSRYRFAD